VAANQPAGRLDPLKADPQAEALPHMAGSIIRRPS